MTYLAGAFAVAWLLTFALVISMIQRQRRLEQEIAALREILEKQR
ncbi:MAG: CcmD family protein [Anaerolineae bacterium]|nr:CcmD family protein [Anaerolineae bacterium]